MIFKFVSFYSRRETKPLKQISNQRALTYFLNFVSAKLAVFLILFTYVFMGNALTAEVAFVTSVLVSQLTEVLTYCMPVAIITSSAALVACTRLQVRYYLTYLSCSFSRTFTTVLVMDIDCISCIYFPCNHYL